MNNRLQSCIIRPIVILIILLIVNFVTQHDAFNLDYVRFEWIVNIEATTQSLNL